ncbi:MAG: hypothetical protein V2I40_13445 [Desulfobacteraceae bacterium]|jgi:hypothetical protein|nr:hypothetical protein [Desulfobacteraceae bacterium]
MRFNTIDRSTRFTDFILNNSIYNNKYLTRITGIDPAMAGSRAAAFLTVHDPVGTGNPGTEADPSAAFQLPGQHGGC